jgi:hypothetical protein
MVSVTPPDLPEDMQSACFRALMHRHRLYMRRQFDFCCDRSNLRALNMTTLLRVMFG